MKKIWEKIRRFFLKLRLLWKRLWKRFSKLSIDQQRIFAAIGIGIIALILFTVAILLGVRACAKDKLPDGTESTLSDAEVQASNDASIGNATTPDPNQIPPLYTDNTGTESTGTSDPTDPTKAPEVTPEPLKKRDEGEAVLELQERLMELGYLSLEEPTQYFGSGTEYALELFQRQHGLEQDGVAGTETQLLLFGDDAQPYVLKEGAEGRDVKMLQEQLVELGYLEEDDVDRIYGPTTIAAVKAFQDRNDLRDDGKAGEKTLAKLSSDDARPSREMEKKWEEEEKRRKEKAEEERAKDRLEEKISSFIKVAKSKIGCEYILGDRGPDTFDCSGLLHYCLNKSGISVRRLNAAGYSAKSSWKEIEDIDDLEKGDLIFFRSDESSRVSHCGIYIGSGTMIDASSTNGKVVKRSLSSYWKRNFVNARRPWE